ncbi:MAG: cyclic nucleotide-binding domain-containing protein [Acidimicrobiia bacterium]
MRGADLAEVPLFASLTDVEREEIAASMRIETIPEDVYVVEEGDLSYKFLVILEGSARVEKNGVHISTLGPGDFFGESGILHREHRNADVISITPMRLGVLISWDVRDLMNRYPSVAARIEAAAEDRV